MTLQATRSLVASFPQAARLVVEVDLLLPRFVYTDRGSVSTRFCNRYTPTKCQSIIPPCSDEPESCAGTPGRPEPQPVAKSEVAEPPPPGTSHAGSRTGNALLPFAAPTLRGSPYIENTLAVRVSTEMPVRATSVSGRPGVADKSLPACPQAGLTVVAPTVLCVLRRHAEQRAGFDRGSTSAPTLPAGIAHRQPPTSTTKARRSCAFATTTAERRTSPAGGNASAMPPPARERVRPPQTAAVGRLARIPRRRQGDARAQPAATRQGADQAMLGLLLLARQFSPLYTRGVHRRQVR